MKSYLASMDVDQRIAKMISRRPLVGEEVVAELLAKKVQSLRRLRMRGMGPHFVKIGGSVRYDLSDVEKYIDQNRRSRTKESDP
ncbi:helix-turn-helix transcriptional regulator [Methylocapsa aurea]|uniref:helix-turn-helix transcriptional regulator n=1 Tax=Methylocapsa aurea TaxID=663610 RepID=UPI0012EC33D4|nr:helix-turn-helix domain-containing protein [Methylocapsa aurea]